jgi:hypothetical protein
MSGEPLHMRVPYTQSYVPAGRRKPVSVDFWGETPIPLHMREISASEAPPAYRIVGMDEPSSRGQYIIRSFEGSLWWLLLNADGFVSFRQFARLAADGERGVFAALDVRKGRPDSRTPDEYYKDNPYRKIVSCTQDLQWARAQRGAAERIMVCDGMVFLQAEDPIYFIIPPWPSMKFRIMAGSSSLDRDLVDRLHLPGPVAVGALNCARQGLAFAADEIDDEVCRLAGRTFDGYDSKIERLTESCRPDVAATAYAGAFIDMLWENTQVLTIRASVLREYVPCLAEAAQNIEMLRRRHQQDLLEQIASMADDPCLRETFSSEIQRAADLVRRLNLLACPPLTDEDRAALSSLDNLL